MDKKYINAFLIHDIIPVSDFIYIYINDSSTTIYMRFNKGVTKAV